MADIETRLSDLQAKVSEMDTKQQVNELRYQHIDEKLENIKAQQKELNGHFSKALGVVVLGVLAAFTKWLLDGGLSGV